MAFIMVSNPHRTKKTIFTPNTPEQELIRYIVDCDLCAVVDRLSQGVDLACQVDGWLPLSIACHLGYTEIVRVLLQYQDGSHKSSIFDAYNDNGDTPLICASREGKLETVQLLLESSACVNTTSNYVHQSPLVVAIENGHSTVAEFLLDKGADIQITDNVGITPLYAAVKNANTRMVERLLEYGADVNVGSQDHAPIFLAARKGFLDIIQLLVKNGCDKDVSNKYGVTPLYEAALKGHIDVLCYMLDEQCNVNSLDMYGVSPLQVAALAGNVDAVRILIQGGSALHVRDQQGRSAFDLAVEMGRAAVVRHLMEIGVNPVPKPDSKLSSISLAFERGYVETAEVLIQGCSKLPLPHYPGVTDLFRMNKRLLQMLLLSGNQTIPGTLVQTVNSSSQDFSSTLQAHPESLSPGRRFLLIQQHVSDDGPSRQPCSLKALCRIRIRRSLGNQILHHAKSLPLPSMLVDYICLKIL